MELNLAASTTQNPLDLANARGQIAGGRLARTSATVLVYAASVGEVTEVNGELLSIVTAAGAVVYSTDLTLNNIIDADGADAGVLPQASTLYWVYLSNSRPSVFPLSLRLCATSPTARQPLPYLGVSGDRPYWRCLGCVYVSLGGALVDTPQTRTVCNFFNARDCEIVVNPGYTNDNATTTYSLNAATWASISGVAANDTFTWIDVGNTGVPGWRGNDPLLTLDVSVALVGAGIARFGVALDGSSTPSCACQFAALAANGSSACAVAAPPLSALYGTLRTAKIVGMTTAVATTVVSDFARTGAAADVPATQLTGVVVC